MARNQKIPLTKELVDRARSKTPWDFGNKVLYDLCEKYPKHCQNEQIIAKVWLIGRAYSAAIERRKEKGDYDGHSIYTMGLAEKMQCLDSSLEPLAQLSDVTYENLPIILSCHAELTNRFSEITKLNKRSLASKYLHFHYRRLFFIYDTRAKKALRLLTISDTPQQLPEGKYDKDYESFCLKVLALRNQIEEQLEVTLSPRCIDNLLLDVSGMSQSNSKIQP